MQNKLPIFVKALLFFVVQTAIVIAQPGTTSTLPQTADLFAGKWLGQGTTPSGEKFKSELSFRSTLDNHFLEVSNKVDDGNQNRQFALTIYGWQPVLGKLVFWSFDRDGTINEGLATLTGKTLTHEWRSFSKGGEIREWRSTLRRTGEEKLHFTLMDGSGQEISSIEYRRK